MECPNDTYLFIAGIEEDVAWNLDSEEWVNDCGTCIARGGHPRRYTGESVSFKVTAKDNVRVRTKLGTGADLTGTYCLHLRNKEWRAMNSLGYSGGLGTGTISRLTLAFALKLLDAYAEATGEEVELDDPRITRGLSKILGEQ